MDENKKINQIVYSQMKHFLSPKLSEEIDINAFKDTRKNDLQYYKPYIKEFEMLSDDLFENETIFGV